MYTQALSTPGVNAQRIGTTTQKRTVSDMNSKRAAPKPVVICRKQTTSAIKLKPV
jgi:hypothetical protein